MEEREKPKRRKHSWTDDEVRRIFAYIEGKNRIYYSQAIKDLSLDCSEKQLRDKITKMRTRGSSSAIVWTQDDYKTLITLYINYGPKWSKISKDFGKPVTPDEVRYKFKHNVFDRETIIKNPIELKPRPKRGKLDPLETPNDFAPSVNSSSQLFNGFVFVCNEDPFSN